MTLKVGSRIMWNCAAYELLYSVLTAHDRESWKARPLFVELPDTVITIQRNDRISYLHTKAA